MNTSLIHTAPHGDFAEVSVLTADWQNHFESLIRDKRPIKLDVYPLPHVLPLYQHRLQQNGYQVMVIENDRWQHFLVPPRF